MCFPYANITNMGPFPCPIFASYSLSFFLPKGVCSLYAIRRGFAPQCLMLFLKGCLVIRNRPSGGSPDPKIGDKLHFFCQSHHKSTNFDFCDRRIFRFDSKSIQKFPFSHKGQFEKYCLVSYLAGWSDIERKSSMEKIHMEKISISTKSQHGKSPGKNCHREKFLEVPERTEKILLSLLNTVPGIFFSDSMNSNI